MDQPFGPLRFEGANGEGVDVDMRTGHRTYQIETSSDDKGYYFDIYQVDQVAGDNFSVREYLHEAHVVGGKPFDTKDAAIAAAKVWIQNQ